VKGKRGKQVSIAHVHNLVKYGSKPGVRGYTRHTKFHISLVGFQLFESAYIYQPVYFKYLDILKNDARCTGEIKSKTSMGKAAFKYKKKMSTSKLDWNLGRS
jgi:hypothetical protein